MRVVFDTSVLVQRVASRRGLLELKAAAERGLIIISSDYILAELERVLRGKFRATKQQAKARSRALAAIALLVTPTDIPKTNRDPNDDSVLAAAVEGRADYIVTMDKDLLDLNQIADFRIISYDEFVMLLRRRLS